MKLILLILVASAGASCSAASYALTRNGNDTTLLLSPSVMLLIAASSGILVRVAEAGTKPGLRLRRRQIERSFLAGATVGELVGFVYWYYSYGYRDHRYFNVVVFVLCIKWVIIGLLGGRVAAVSAVPETKAPVQDDL